jgi:phage I-like protein
MNNFMQFMQQFNQFRQSMQGQNPDQIIQNMMSQGRISQSQYEQARQMASQIQKMIPGAQG